MLWKDENCKVNARYVVGVLVVGALGGIVVVYHQQQSDMGAMPHSYLTSGKLPMSTGAASANLPMSTSATSSNKTDVSNSNVTASMEEEEEGEGRNSSTQTVLTSAHTTYKRADWRSGLDRPYVYQQLYRRVKELAANKETRHLLWNITLIKQFYEWRLNLKRYIHDLAAEGSPLEPLPRYTNPCWREKASSTAKTSKLRCLPGIILAGFPKSGTTDLHGSLVLHPQVQKADNKELSFWISHKQSTEPVKSTSTSVLQRYCRHFDGAAQAFQLKANLGIPSYTLDAFPGIAWRPTEGYHSTGVFIRSLTPNAKILFILRNPAERAISHYKHFGKSTAKVMYQTMENTVKRLKACIHENGARYCAYRGLLFGDNQSAALRAGMYFLYLREWLDVFPKDQVFIIKAEEYYQNRRQHMDHVYDFLKLDPLPNALKKKQETASVANSNNHSWSQTRVTKDQDVYFKKAKKLLTEFYEPFNIKLAELLGEEKYLLWNNETLSEKKHLLNPY